MSASLEGELTLPAAASSLVVFAPGSRGRDQFIATALSSAGLGTLVVESVAGLGSSESVRLEPDGSLQSEPDEGPLLEALDWLRQDPETSTIPLVLFACGRSAAAALRVAAREPRSIAGLIFLAGRPDSALDAAAHVRVPTLLLVGEDDIPMRELSEMVATELAGSTDICLVAGATRLQDEPASWETVARLVRSWLALRLDAHAEVEAFLMGRYAQ